MKLRGITSVDKLKRAISKEHCIVYCSTSWSIPCLSQYSILARVAEDCIGWDAIVEVDIDKYPDAASVLTIQSIPTTIVFSNGEEAGRFVGLRSFRTLHAALENIWPAGLANRSNEKTETIECNQSNI